ncbi:MAG: hypothetical protein ABJA71_14705 [Ginsengibacter sp.]
MKRGSLLLIGVASAIITIISLNFAFGRSWNYYDNRWHHCNERYHKDADKNDQRNQENQENRSQ